MLQLNIEPQRLSSTFLAYRNDIDIYTEDNEKDKEFYRVLFRRLLRNDIVINDVTPLGSRDQVMQRCKDEPKNGRKKIFIIDGDISIIHGKDIPIVDNLFVLDAYCIENFLFDKETVIHFIYLSCGTKPKESIEAELAFDEWLSNYSTKFIKLFIHFALTNYFGGYFTLFNANKYHTKTKDNIVFVEELVDEDIKNIKNEILKTVSEEEYEKKRAELEAHWTDCTNNLFTIVSGKDYLIPILLIKTQSFKKSKALPTLEEIKFSLAQFCKLERLSELKKKIEAL